MVGESFVVGVGSQVPVICHMERELSLRFIEVPGLEKASDGGFGGSGFNSFIFPQKRLTGFPDGFKRVFEALDGGITVNVGHIFQLEDVFKGFQGFFRQSQPLGQAFHGIPVLITWFKKRGAAFDKSTNSTR